MCQGSMHEFLKALPKCEHHMHVEGSLEPELLFQLAKRNNISLPSPEEDEAYTSEATLSSRYSRFTSLDDFLHYYFIGMSVLIHESDFESLAYSYFARAHSQGVYHAEIFFDPQAHTSRGVEFRTALEGLTQAQLRAVQDFDMTSELIVCMLRHLPVPDCRSMYFTSLPYLQSGSIRGLGLSSTELGHPPSDYKAIYADAASQGVTHLTAHAGEEADVTYMASAVHDLKCVRVDHGIKLLQDPDLLSHFVQQKILITMCPISNRELKCVSKIGDLPIREYLDAGVRFSINSDDPAYFGGGTYILENYCAVQEALDLTRDEWVTICRNAIEGSWCSQDRKSELLAALQKVG